MSPLNLKVVDWNVNGFTHRSQPEFLAALDWDIACLPEVTRETWDAFKAVADDGEAAFDHLPPLAGQGPRYACAVLIRGDLRLDGFTIVWTSPRPSGQPSPR